MPLLKDYNTLGDIFWFLYKEHNSNREKPLLRYKKDGKFIGITKTEFGEQIEYFALGLKKLGIQRLDNIAIISENRPEWILSDMAILSLGAVNVPLYPILTADSIEYILNDSSSKGIIVSNKFQMNKIIKIKNQVKSLEFIISMNELEFKEENAYSFTEVIQLGKEIYDENKNYVKNQLDKTEDTNLCTIIYTSGTTGTPKGVMLTHRNILSNVKSSSQLFNIDENDEFLSFLPLCHIFERMAGYYLALSIGATISFAESIEKIAQNFLEVRPTVMGAVPRLFERMFSKVQKTIESQSSTKQKLFNWAIEVGRKYQKSKKSQEPMSISLTLKHKMADSLVLKKLRHKLTGGRLRFFISGGAALSRDLGEFFEAAGILILEGYGLTESSPVLTVNRENDYKFGSVGKTIPGVEIKIAKDGEILAYGPNIMTGYYNNKKETEKTIIDGWLHTGDIGVFDAEGFLLITDRKKHLFKTSGGKYIAPAPIESMFLGSKYIEQFVLIGDRRMFLSALIVPDFEALKEFADANRIAYSDERELVKLKQINELLDEELKKFQKNLANFERIRKFTLLEKPFTIEDGEMTPKLSLKRKVIEERYKDLIEDMYKELQ